MYYAGRSVQYAGVSMSYVAKTVSGPGCVANGCGVFFYGCANCYIIPIIYMYKETEIFRRTQRLAGAGGMARLHAARVLVVGVGGVGSWCAEALVRSGIRRLTIADMDSVCVSNINRQLPATTSTVGRPKVEVMRERLLDINPHAEIEALQRCYTAETADSFALQTFDYVVDAIDSLAHKAHLIRSVCAQPATRLFSSMGAAMKSDPSHIGVAEFWKVKGCPLAAALRRRFKREKQFPARKFKCVYSDELLPNLGADAVEPNANGTFVHATAIFGLTLAGLVVRDALSREVQPTQD